MSLNKSDSAKNEREYMKKRQCEANGGSREGVNERILFLVVLELHNFILLLAVTCLKKLQLLSRSIIYNKGQNALVTERGAIFKCFKSDMGGPLIFLA